MHGPGCMDQAKLSQAVGNYRTTIRKTTNQNLASTFWRAKKCLLEAAANRDVAKAVWALRTSVDPNATISNNSRLPLHVAANTDTQT